MICSPITTNDILLIHQYLYGSEAKSMLCSLLHDSGFYPGILVSMLFWCDCSHGILWVRGLKGALELDFDCFDFELVKNFLSFFMFPLIFDRNIYKLLLFIYCFSSVIAVI